MKLGQSSFEFTKDDTPILASEVTSLMSSFDKKKLEVELSSRNIFKKKCQTKSNSFYSKWCYYGIKKRETLENLGICDDY